MIATATGLAIAGMAASAGSQLYGAKKASDASKKAGDLQSQAADRAQGNFDKAKATTDAIYQPYLTQGRAAASTLGRLVTPGTGARYAAPDPTQPPAPPPQPPMSGRPMPPGAPTSGPAVPRTLGSMAPPPQGPPPQGPPQQPQGQPGGGMVMLEANDGSGARPVPASQAQRFLATGNFRRVG